MANEVEILDQIMDSVDELKKKSAKEIAGVLSQASEMVEKSSAERRQEAQKWFEDLSKKVEEINTEVAKKGATVNQMMEELEEFKAKGGRGNMVQGGTGETTHEILAKGFEDNYAAYSQKKPNLKAEFHLKAVGTMTVAANLTGSIRPDYASANAVRGRRKTHIRDIVPVIQSATGLWKFYRQNSPVGEGSFGFQGGAGNLKPELDYDFTEVTVTADYLAGIVRIAKQMLQDLPFMQSYVTNELVEDYMRAEDATFFNQLAAAATGTGTISSTVTVEKIIDGIANIENADFEVNGILTDSLTWAKVLKTKPNDYSIPGGVTINANGDVQIVGIPLMKITGSYIGAGNILLGDFSKAAIIQTEGLSVNMYEQDRDNIVRNLVTIRAEARVGFANLRPDAFAFFAAGTT